jgi:hypothetical protein
METKGNVTRAQTKFLRGFVANPAGPPPEQWPSPVVLRRWLKRPGFCGAMNSILRALRYQADFHLTAAAASGANLLHGAVHGGDALEARKHIEALIHLLRMNHIRQRFAEPLPQPEPVLRDWIKALRLCAPNITVRDALALGDALYHDDGEGEGEFPGDGIKLWRKTGHPDSPYVAEYEKHGFGTRPKGDADEERDNGDDGDDR